MPLPPLYKYLNVRGAKLTLGNRTFRHAKPSDFNDIEDMTVGSVFPEEIEAALKKLSDGATDVILAHLDDPPTCPSPMREQVALLQNTFRRNPKADEIVKAELMKDGGEPLFDVEHMRERAKAYVEEINTIMQEWRILCVSANKDSDRMWSEYAEDHKGIVLRIEPNIEKDSKFQRFRPVIYRDKRPPLYEETMKFLADGLFADQQARTLDIMDKIIYSKTLKWRHECEYRLAIPLRQNEASWDTLPYHPEEITEIYLGSALQLKDWGEIVRAARAINQGIAIFQAKRWSTGAMTFDPI